MVLYVPTEIKPKRKQKEEKEKKGKKIKLSDYNWLLNYEEEEGHPDDI